MTPLVPGDRLASSGPTGTELYDGWDVVDVARDLWVLVRPTFLLVRYVLGGVSNWLDIFISWLFGPHMYQVVDGQLSGDQNAVCCDRSERYQRGERKLDEDLGTANLIVLG
ncbi:unnamed protein product [Schistosoma rodhaini]|uniref:Uncharacterized protein n=1 Tax=Schistosoma rodhaini TaxID=6188 RepID=A0AA85EU09_9TREM|nr:unnamed protein product [Schistosoma rodhaini]